MGRLSSPSHERRTYAEMLVKIMGFLSAPDLPSFASGVVARGSARGTDRQDHASAAEAPPVASEAGSSFASLGWCCFRSHRPWFEHKRKVAEAPFLPAVVQEDPDELQAIKRIELLGGRVTRDGQIPGRPVTMISLDSGSRFSDKDFHLLKPFKALKTLNLGGVEIASGGLKGLADGRTSELHLIGSTITDASLKEIGQLRNLTTLGLIAARITDAGLKELSTHVSLRILLDGRPSPMPA